MRELLTERERLFLHLKNANARPIASVGRTLSLKKLFISRIPHCGIRG